MTSEIGGILIRAKKLLQDGSAAEARELIETSHDGVALDPEMRRILAQSMLKAGDLNAAIDCHRSLVPIDLTLADKQGRADALTAARLAQLAMYYSEAAEIARRLVACDPQNVEAASLLATLVLWTEGPMAARNALSDVLSFEKFPPHLVAETLAFYDDPPAGLKDRARSLAENTRLPPHARADLFLALAQNRDSVGDYDEAWELAVRGNALAPARAPQDWRGVLNAHRAIYDTTSPVESQADFPRHLYLLGTPRSAQSLLQSILAAAPDVASIGERGALLQHVLYRTGDISRQTVTQREKYFGELAASDRRGISRLAGKPRLVVDKSPLHLAVAGSVARIHPQAVFAAVLRDPADTAMSIWLRSFPPVYDYATNLGATLDHLDFALDALAEWREAGIVIRLIDHADLVANPASESKAMFESLNLCWNDDYLKPENRTEPVPTFSAAQVRKPISETLVSGAAPYAGKLSAYSDQIDTLRRKTKALLDAKHRK